LLRSGTDPEFYFMPPFHSFSVCHTWIFNVSLDT